MGFLERGLSLDEQLEIAELLSESGPRTLVFARGVFAASATAPQPLDPTDWLPLVLGDEIPNSTTLKRILTLLVRDSNHVASLMQAGESVLPESTDRDVLREYCRGYVQVAQKTPQWTSNQAAFDLTLPMMVLSGYVDSKSLAAVKPEAADDPESYAEECVGALESALPALYAHFASARAEQRSLREAAQGGKVGRNEPCPCGSGKKFKKCCGAV